MPFCLSGLAVHLSLRVCAEPTQHVRLCRRQDPVGTNPPKKTRQRRLHIATVLCLMRSVEALLCSALLSPLLCLPCSFLMCHEGVSFMLCYAGAAKPKCNTDKSQVPGYLPTQPASLLFMLAGGWAAGVGRHRHRHKAEG